MALLRVKRRLNDDPIDVLLLSCKRPKTEANTVTKVFKFAATVDEQDADIKRHITEVKGAKRQPLKYREQSVSAITEKLRSENKISSRENRLKVVNWFRAVAEEGQMIGEDDTFTVVDLVNIERSESPSPTNAVIDTSTKKVSLPLTEEQYVYDLYYSAIGGDIDDLQMENLLSVHAVNEDLIFGDYMEDGDDDTTYDDEDDSNDENNWRNDYPDEKSDAESFSSDDENLMRMAVQMKNIAINDEYQSDLSSDEEDSLLIYSEQDPSNFYYHSEPSRSESSSSYYSTD